MSLELLIAGVVAAAAVFLLLIKMGLRKALGYDVPIDITVTGALIWAFNGTYSGMIAATIAGALFSVVMYAAKITLGYERLEFTGRKLIWRRHH